MRTILRRWWRALARVRFLSHYRKMLIWQQRAWPRLPVLPTVKRSVWIKSVDQRGNDWNGNLFEVEDARLDDVKLENNVVTHTSQSGGLRVSLVSDEHRCSGCGLRWDGADLNGAELCGDCWRTAQRRLHGPRVVCLCGSTKFIEQFACATWELELRGYVVLGCTLLPSWFCPVRDHFAESQGVKPQRDAHHLQKIDLADEVLVLDINGYIGESTRNEINYAQRQDKPVRYVSANAALLAKILPRQSSPASPHAFELNPDDVFSCARCGGPREAHS